MMYGYYRLSLYYASLSRLAGLIIVHFAPDLLGVCACCVRVDVLHVLAGVAALAQQGAGQPDYLVMAEDGVVGACQIRRIVCEALVGGLCGDGHALACYHSYLHSTPHFLLHMSSSATCAAVDGACP